MTHYACPCLNVHIFCVKECPRDQQEDSVEGFQLSALSLQDPFFKLTLCQTTLDKKGVQSSQSCLVDTRTVDKWTIHTCLSCRKDTHAVTNQTNCLLVNSTALLSDGTQIKSLLLSANYSHLYRMILPSVSHNANSSNNESTSPVRNSQLRTMLQTIREQAADYLLQEQKQLEQSIRQYTENQYALYAVLQDRVARERQSLLELTTCAFQKRQKDSGLRVTSSKPYDQYPSPPTSPDSSGDPPVAVNRPEVKDKKNAISIVRLTHRLPANQRTLMQKPRNISSTRNGNVLQDENAIFDMEGLENEEVGPGSNSFQEDELDDSTMEDVESSVQNPPVRHKYASSVPISVPFMTTYNHFSNSLEDPTPGDPDKIAASIQALALSIRDERTMFGELPRRQMNTGDLVKVRPI